MAQGALHFGAATSDRADSGQPAGSLNLNTLTVLLWARYTGVLATNMCLLGSPANAADNLGSMLQWRTSGAIGDVELRITQATTNLSVITSDTPFATTAWKCMAGSYDVGAGTRGRIYTGGLGTPMAENTYGGTTTQGVGARVAEAGTKGFTWGNRWSATNYSNAFRGDIAIAALFGSVLTLTEIESWRQCPRKTIGAATAIEFKRFGKGGADGIDYCGNTNSTVTGATQIDGPPVGGMWTRQNGLYRRAA